MQIPPIPLSALAAALPQQTASITKPTKPETASTEFKTIVVDQVEQSSKSGDRDANEQYSDHNRRESDSDPNQKKTSKEKNQTGLEAIDPSPSTLDIRT